MSIEATAVTHGVVGSSAHLLYRRSSKDGYADDVPSKVLYGHILGSTLRAMVRVFFFHGLNFFPNV